MNRLLVAVILLAVMTPAQADKNKAMAVHTGVATCASSLCHGSAREKEASDILRNEYITWQRHDAHSQAYQTLLSKESRAMAARLGLGKAHEAEVCLNCHTDNVPPQQRGERFQLSDGVGCEACHGGAENWLESHTVKDVKHAENVKKGLVPLEQASVRAGVCQQCHIGDADHFAGHDIMGAGHPRLQFELMTYSILQPYHYRTDGDYFARKPKADRVAMIWAVGQVSAARHMIEGLQSERFMVSGLWPEPAFFDCHACHAPMGADKWAPRFTSKPLAPGSIRLNDSALVMVLILEEVIPGGNVERLLAEIRGLHGASQQSREGVRRAAAVIGKHLDALQSRLAATELTPELQRQLIRRIADYSAEGRFNDYLTAEQAVMAVQLLLKRGAPAVQADLDPAVKAVFDSLEDSDRLEQRAFLRAMKTLRARL
jgi:hypothetical protein